MKFVYLNKNILINNTLLEKNLVGIVKNSSKEKILVDFTVMSSPEWININDISYFNPEETGDLYEKKVCNVCCKLLDTNLFSRNQNGKNNRIIRRPSCINCREIIDGVNVSMKDKRIWEKRKPDMEIFECPICHKKTIPGLTSKIVLDHDHANGHVRGWICDSCNTGIGRFKDSIELLQSAIKYLQNTDEEKL